MGVVEHVQLQPETIAAFETYIAEVDRSAEAALSDPKAPLWSEADSDRLKRLQKGTVVAEFWDPKSKAPVAVTNGLIHDWIGAARVPNSTVQQALALVQDYDNHKNVFKPEVLDSRLLSRDGEDFTLYLRLLKKKIITVVLDSHHQAHYSSPSPQRAFCRSRSTEIREVQNVGTPNETALPPDTGYGFLWRLFSYWRFEQGEDALVVECRAVSLTRDIPSALAWLINPIVRQLPKESLVHTLQAVQKSLRPSSAVSA